MKKLIESLGERIGDIAYSRFMRQLKVMPSRDTQCKGTTVTELIEQLKTMPSSAKVKIGKGAFMVGSYTHMESTNVHVEPGTDKTEPSVILYADWFSGVMSRGVDY